MRSSLSVHSEKQTEGGHQVGRPISRREDERDPRKLLVPEFILEVAAESALRHWHCAPRARDRIVTLRKLAREHPRSRLGTRDQAPNAGGQLGDFSVPANVEIDFAVARRNAVDCLLEVRKRSHYLTRQHDADPHAQQEG